jgi:hypothetical protein
MSSESPGNIVTIAIGLRGEQPRTCGSSSDRDDNFVYFKISRPARRPTHTPIDTEGFLSVGVMRPGLEANYLTPSRIEAMQSLSDMPSWLAEKQVCFNIQLYITGTLSYSLKMASCKPKHCSCYVLVMYRVSIKSFFDYKHLLQENYIEYTHIFLQLLKLFVKKLLELHFEKIYMYVFHVVFL